MVTLQSTRETSSHNQKKRPTDETGGLEEKRTLWRVQNSTGTESYFCPIFQTENSTILYWRISAEWLSNIFMLKLLGIKREKPIKS